MIRCGLPGECGRKSSPAPAVQAVPRISNADIRREFLAAGFTIKPGHDDLKPYVYEAARRVLALAAAAPVAPVEIERNALRAGQAAAVMPLIGPLLDAWECCSQSVHDEHPALDTHLRLVNRAMEDSDAPVLDFARAIERAHGITAGGQEGGAA